MGKASVYILEEYNIKKIENVNSKLPLIFDESFLQDIIRKLAPPW